MYQCLQQLQSEAIGETREKDQFRGRRSHRPRWRVRFGDGAGSCARPAKRSDAGRWLQSQEGAEFKDGKWVLPDGTPTFRVCHKEGGTFVVDWATYNGYRRYHGECHVCHGPNGLGSTYAPALRGIR